MSNEGTGEQIADFAIRTLKSLFFEQVAHGQIRKGFVLGLLIMGASAAALRVWLVFHPDLHANITLAGLCFIAAIGLVGSLVQTDTDIADQQTGRYSKWGSGWNLWGDNLCLNHLAKSVEILGICGCLIASAYFASAAVQEKHSVSKITQATKIAFKHTSPTSAAHAAAGHHHSHSKHVQHSND